MNKTIKAIDKEAVHRICSGQVVLNLAVAVKELVENSLDAGASVIEVRLREFGSELIEVTDNGSGVEPSNFEGLTLKHHTSKLQDFSDLVSVETFGFRGEALSSLCSLSDLTVTTRHRTSDCGTRLQYDHDGLITSSTAVARQVGTTVCLENIFSTLPVRHKEFLRHLKREFGKMTQLLYAYCLVSTGVRITCTNHTKKGGKMTVVATHGCKTVRENISCVFGTKQLTSLLELKTVAPDQEMLEQLGLKNVEVNVEEVFQLEGLVSSCAHGQGRSTNDRQFYYINSRPCEPTKVMKAVNEVFHQYNFHQQPFVFLNVSSARDSVDVNVTPDKRQVFLEHEKLLIATVKASLQNLYENIPSTYTVNNILPPVKNVSSPPKSAVSQNSPASILSQFRHASANKRPGSDQLPLKSPKQAKLDSIFSKQDKTFTNNYPNETPLEQSKNSNPKSNVDLTVTFTGTSETKDSIETQSKTSNPISNVASTVNFTGASETKDESIFDTNISEIHSKNPNSTLNQEDKVIILEEHKLIRSHDKDFKSEVLSNTNQNLASDGLESEPVSQKSSSSQCSDLYNLNCADNSETLSSDKSIVHLLIESGISSQSSSTSDMVPISSVVTEELVQSDNEVDSGKSSGIPLTLVDMSCDLKTNKLETSVSVEFDSQVVINNESRRTIEVDMTMDKLTDRFRKSCEMENAVEDKKVKFRAVIDPSKNKLAEQELSREISKDMFAKMEVIGQFNLGFIIARLGADLFIVDQHATDEKYNFETLQRTETISSQKLVVPQQLDLTAVNEAVLMDNIDVFRANGFEFLVDESAPTTSKVKLTSIPMSRNWTFGKEDIDELLFMLQDAPGTLCRPSRVRAMFASRACRKSVMIGSALSRTEMKRLLVHMGEIEQPWNCPHGRPTMRHLINLDFV